MDFVTIVTPNRWHFEPAMMALERGFHVVVDKPMTFSLEEAKQLQKKVEETGLVLALTHVYSAYPAVKEAKARIAKGELGKLRRVYVEYTQGWLSERIELLGGNNAEMAHGGVQQMEVVLHTQLFEFGAGGGIEFRAFSAVGHVDLVDVAHQLQRSGLAQILVKRAAKIVGNVVFSVGKSACAAETAHNGAAFAGNTGFDLNAVNGTFAVFQRMSGLEDGDLQLRAQPGQLIGGKDTAGPRADNDHIVIHDYLTTYNFAVNHLRRLVETLNHIMSLYPSSITQPQREQCL